MHINTPPFTQQVAHQRQAFVHHVQVGIDAFAPSVAIGDGFQDGLLFEYLVAVVADLDFHGEVCADIEGRVDVDEVDLAAKLLQQGRHHEFVVAPDEHVAEVVAMVLLAERGFVEERALLVRFGFAGIEGHIDGLDALQGQGRGGQVHGAAVAVLVVLALPHQFGLHLRERMRIVGTPARHRSSSYREQRLLIQCSS
jgi:hypothetical protein